MTADDLPLVRRWLGDAARRRNGGTTPHEQFELVSGDLDHPDDGAVHRRRATRGRSPICNATTSSALEHRLRRAAGRHPRHRSVHRRADMLGRGHGSAFIRAFADRLCWRTARRASSSIPIRTTRAPIRAYEKAGFRRDRLVDTPDGAALLMVATQTTR